MITPILASRLRRALASTFLLLGLALGAALSPAALAAGFPPVGAATATSTFEGDPNSVNFTASDKDVSIGLLQAVLGNWKDSAPDPTMGALFKAFNLGVLVFGSMLFLYVSTVGILHSAEDGAVLGKRWGSMFVPLRMAGGMALLFPMANGYSAVQIIVLWLATNGVGFANWTMEQTLDSFVKNQGTAVTLQLVDASALADTMTNVLQAEACVAEHNWQLRDPANPSGITAFGGPTIEEGTGNNTYGKVSWGLLPGAPAALTSGFGAEDCGAIEIPNFNSFLGAGNGDGGVAQAASNMVSGFSRMFKGANLNDANVAVRKAHFAALDAAADKLRPLAVSMVKGENAAGSATTLAAQVGIAALEYRANIAARLNQPGVLPSTTEMARLMQQGIKDNGWSTLGTWFYQYARIGSALSTMTSYAPEMTRPAKAGETDQAIQDALAGALSQSAANPATVVQIKGNNAFSKDSFSAGSSEGGVEGWMVGATNSAANTSARFLGETFGVDSSNKLNAVMQLKNVGDNILSAAQVLYVGKQVYDAGKAVASKTAVGAVVGTATGNSVKKFMGALGSEFATDTWGLMKFIGLFAAFAMLGFGMTLAFWVPMAPFVLWLGAVTGWVIAVLEMVCAAPLWAAAHLHPEGEGMASKYGASGYMIIIEVFAKPVLMVVGFFVAARFVDPFLRFASGMFFNNMATINGDSITGILTTIAFVFIYVGFCVTLVQRSFTLIHVIPNSVLRWIGAGGDRFTNVADISDDMGRSVGGYFGVMKGIVDKGGKAKVATDVVGDMLQKKPAAGAATSRPGSAGTPE